MGPDRRLSGFLSYAGEAHLAGWLADQPWQNIDPYKRFVLDFQ